ncbi:hypothetical protein [Kitasatospora cineracea]|uniref:hypothetical protein n=1 Tax=Kitasatospora cineracea TaxID=88074 RepID=UPI00379B5B96
MDRLLGISSAALRGESAEGVGVPSLLQPLIAARNGFFAFESALLVRPWGGGRGTAEWWNSGEVWRDSYDELPTGLTFFAEDIFGFQFAVDEGGFCSFDPETAESERISDSLDGWIDYMLSEYDEATGYSIAHEWQSVNGPIPAGSRLAPAVPFVLGGSYDADALAAKSDVELARFRATIFNQIRNLPDGAQVRITIE